MMKKKVITYGTYDLFHHGHLNLLTRARVLGDHLTVAISTDTFNASKGKATVIPFVHRKDIVAALRCVDATLPENDWDQKRADIIDNNIDIFVMGDDWKGKFDYLSDICQVIYLPRTEGISTTKIKDILGNTPSEKIIEGAVRHGEIYDRFK